MSDCVVIDTSVADRHFRHCSPEFAEWFADEAGNKLPMLALAQLVVATLGEAHQLQVAKGVADTVRDDWREFVASCTDYDSWPLARQMYREVRRET